MVHTAVILTSERCGHCRNMRGNGKLLSKAEIKKDNKQPTIPGGNHFDASWMSKLITAGMDKDAKIKVVNLHYKSFNPAEGLMDISIFTLENNKEVRQTMLKESGSKTNMSIYVVGEGSKTLSSSDISTTWAEISNTYVPINISMYAYFFPSIILFEENEWMSSIQNKVPIYGFLNGFKTKEQSPFGALTGSGIQPNVKDFVKFIGEFFDGTRKLTGKPKASEVVTPVEEPVVIPVKKPESSGTVLVPTSNQKRNFRLYVVEK